MEICNILFYISFLVPFIIIVIIKYSKTKPKNKKTLIRNNSSQDYSEDDEKEFKERSKINLTF